MMARPSTGGALSLSQLTLSPPETRGVTTGARLALLMDGVARARESRGVCDKVLARLHVLQRQLEHMVSMTASSTGSRDSTASGVGVGMGSAEHRAQSKVAELGTQLEAFVADDAARHIVLRLTDSRRFKQLQDMQEELDAVFRMLRLEHVDPERQWRAEWAADRADVERQFQQALATKETLFRELRTPNEQQEALAMLRHTIEKAPPYQSTQQLPPFRPTANVRPAAPVPTQAPAAVNVTLELAKAAFRKLVSMSNVDIPAVPSWFISPAEMSVESEPFTGGEHAQVFRASWGRFKTLVAIKYAAAGDEHSRTALLQEADVWCKLDHLSVLKMHGGFPVGQSPFLALEYPANGSLDEYLASDASRSPYRLLYQAASGLKYLHDQQVQCPGLTLSTIYVGNDGVAKIGQFSSFFWKKEAMEKPRPDVGAVRWKAPEVLRDDASRGLPADVYAFAMCMLEAVTGELPWGWLTDAEVRTRVLAGQLPDRPAGVMSDAAWCLIASMCALDPAQRPTMEAVVQQLQAIVDEEEKGQARGPSRSSSMSSASVMEDLHDDEYELDGRRKNQNLTMMSIDVDELVTSSRRGGSTMLGEEPSTAAAPTISVVTLHHKWLGVKINSIGNRIVVSKFLRSSSGALGEIEASGQVRLGDVIVAVNNRSVRGMDRHQIGQVIQNTPRPMQLMFMREPDLLEECYQFHGLRLEERWRDRGSIVPMPNGVEMLFGSVHDSFTFSVWFSLSDADDTFFGGVLLGAQDVACHDQAWPYIHHQLVMVDPQGNLSCFFLHDDTPVLIGRELHPSRWYNLVVVYNSQAVTVYLDGQVKHHANGVLYRDWPRLSHVNIGSGCISRAPPSAKPTPDFCGWYGFNGLVYEATVWHSALRELDVQQVFRGAMDFVSTPVYSMRRDIGKDYAGAQPPRRVQASRPLHVVAQTYC